MTNEIFLEKFEKGEEFTEDELIHVVNEFNEVETIKGDDRRWTRDMTTIVEVNSRYFAIYWEHGLTEEQPDMFYNQPREVIKKEYEKTIVVKEWIEKYINLK